VSLLEAQDIVKRVELGAVLLDMSFGRGVNLRYAKDAEVIVVGNGG
jgi:hypothetical protein